MAVASFDALAEGFCELAGFASPTLENGGAGHRAFSMRMRDVVLTFVELAATREHTACLVAEFGALATQHELRGLVALLDANALLLGAEAPRFSRNPRTGEIVMQWPCELGAVTAVEAYERATRMVDAALAWRRDPFLGPAMPLVRESGASKRLETDAAGEAGAAAATRFRALHAALRTAAGQREPQDRHAPPPAESAFSFRLRGMDLVLCHSPSHRPHEAFAALLLPGVATGLELQRLREMLDANFALVALPHGASYARHPATGRLVLQRAIPLADADADRCLQELDALVALHLAAQAPAGTPAVQPPVSAALRAAGPARPY